MSVMNAAIAAGFPRSLVEKHRKKLPVPLTPNNTTDFLSLFEQKQMTDVKKVEHCLEGMNAMRTAAVILVDENEQPVLNARGRPQYREVEIPDWQMRHKYFESMLKMCKQLNQTDTNNTLVFLGNDFANKLKEARERATEEMKEKLRRATPQPTGRARERVIDATAQAV